VGLAGNVVPLGQTINSLWADPFPGCVSQNSAEDFVLCNKGQLPTGTIIQFRAGLHSSPSGGTMGGTYACSAVDCQGRCFIYHDGPEVGKLDQQVVSGNLAYILHYQQPPVFQDLLVVVP
jgi:hypothetical protein